jgi:hypothetical protein
MYVWPPDVVCTVMADEAVTTSRPSAREMVGSETRVGLLLSLGLSVISEGDVGEIERVVD